MSNKQKEPSKTATFKALLFLLFCTAMLLCTLLFTGHKKQTEITIQLEPPNSNSTKYVTEEIEDYIGLGIEIEQLMEQPDNIPGIYVTGVSCTGPAAHHLKFHDRFIQIDGTAITRNSSLADVTKLLTSDTAQSTVRVTIERLTYNNRGHYTSRNHELTLTRQKITAEDARDIARRDNCDN